MNIGDVVKVVREGSCYAHYETWARKHSMSFFRNNASPNKGAIGRVVAIAPHMGYPKITLVGIRCDNQDYIMTLDAVAYILNSNDLIEDATFRAIQMMGGCHE